jgi:hypothetical protein
MLKQASSRVQLKQADMVEYNQVRAEWVAQQKDRSRSGMHMGNSSPARSETGPSWGEVQRARIGLMGNTSSDM